MSQITNITIEEAMYLLKSTINEANDTNKPLSADDITTESITSAITQYRAINSAYDKMRDNVRSGKPPLEGICSGKGFSAVKNATT